MQGTLKFNLPEEQSEFEMAVTAPKMHIALWEISQEIFRPHRKHGYADSRIQEKIDAEHGAAILEVISLLEERFWEIINNNNIEIS